MELLGKKLSRNNMRSQIIPNIEKIKIKMSEKTIVAQKVLFILHRENRVYIESRIVRPLFLIHFMNVRKR
jgi:hypothetical protein